MSSGKIHGDATVCKRIASEIRLVQALYLTWMREA